MWAVGSYTGSNAGASLEHWNGSAWTIDTSHTIVYGQYLNGVVVFSSTNAWAVGDTPNHALTMHWDGTAWRDTTNGTSDNDALYGVSGTSPNDMWAVGTTGARTTIAPLILHYNGSAWSHATIPSSTGATLAAVHAISTTDVWAVGKKTSQTQTNPFILHFNGSAWSEVQIDPLPFGGQFNAVNARSATDVWAAGNLGSFAQFDDYQLMAHYDGTSWTYNQSGTRGTLDGISFTGPNDMWVSGFTYDLNTGVDIAELLHGDGAYWDARYSENLAYTDLTAVLAFDNTNVWAVGRTSTKPLIERYFCSDGSTPTPTDTPTVGPTFTPVPAVTPSPTETAAPPTATATVTPSFSDVYPTDYFYNAVQFLAAHGVINGYDDGTFRPYSNMTRGQLAKVVVLAEGWGINTSGGPHFNDVPTSYPFYAFIETAYNHGTISGYADGSFRPGANMTRGQLTKVVSLAEGWTVNTTGGPHFTDVPASHPFYSFIETAYQHSVISGYDDGTFRPNAYMTRGQVAKIVYLAIAVNHLGNPSR
jgi:hypothetical protein